MTDYRANGISADGVDIEVSVETSGEPEAHAEKVHMHVQDAAARAIQALETGELPADCDGIGIVIDWEGVLAGEYDDKEVRADGGKEIQEKTKALREPGSVTVEYSDADGSSFTEEFHIERGSAMVIEGPDGFLLTYTVSPEVGDE